MGGRMTTQAAAGGLEGVRGIVLLGFPLHPARRPATSRGSHLADVELPMLFVQGSRDALAELELLGPLCTGLGDHVTLHVIDQADHSFAVRNKAGRTAAAVMAELADTVADWARRVAL
jgi:hypothetical protein